MGKQNKTEENIEKHGKPRRIKKKQRKTWETGQNIGKQKKT